MKRIGPVILALLAAVLMPVLIWVALFVAIREPLLRALRRSAFAAVSVLAGILYPVLIWVGLFAAMRERARRWRLQRAPVRTVGEVLAAVGLTLGWEGPKEATPVAALFLPMPISEVRRVLVEAGLRGNIG